MILSIGEIVGFLTSLSVAWDFSGRPAISVTSWFRSPEHNREVGGSPESQHLFGLAVDLIGAPTALERFGAAAAGQGLVPVHSRDRDTGQPYLHVQRFPAGHLAQLGVRFPV